MLLQLLSLLLSSLHQELSGESWSEPCLALEDPAEIRQLFRLRCVGHDGCYIGDLEGRYGGNFVSPGELRPFQE
jgi:hypothetical protein